MLIYKKIAKSIPGLGLKLRQARLAESPDYYIQKTLFMSLFLSFGLLFVAFGLTKSFLVIIAFPVVFVFAFFYFLRFADVKIKKIENEVNQEIVFAGRYLLIELESGVPLYDSFQNIAKNYKAVGLYFTEVIQKVDLGTTMEEAINETLTLTPSANMRKLLWQVLNSLKTGSDIRMALNSIIDQIVREQKIAVSEYGRKLNPLAMFYMMIAVIIPSLGIVMLVVLATFIGLELDLFILMVFSAAIGFMQFMFMAIIKSSRPAVDL
ncbi:type II secretion system F family protein [Candidatus Woesearchaeota archaeon]|nr:type II secretion system F family protein [Candidatus Woesearchaeota archaeon]